MLLTETDWKARGGLEKRRKLSDGMRYKYSGGRYQRDMAERRRLAPRVKKGPLSACSTFANRLSGFTDNNCLATALLLL